MKLIPSNVTGIRKGLMRKVFITVIENRFMLYYANFDVKQEEKIKRVLVLKVNERSVSVIEIYCEARSYWWR